MKFVALTERNNKEHETFYFFLQWEGNEEALTLLNRIVNSADVTEMYYGDFSIFRMNLDMKFNKFSENTIKEMRKARFLASYAEPIEFCTGKFVPPFTEEVLEEETPRRLASLLDQWFYPSRIGEYFK